MEIHTGRIIAVKKMMCIGSLITESMSVIYRRFINSGAHNSKNFRLNYQFYKSLSMKTLFSIWVMKFSISICTSIWNMLLEVNIQINESSKN